MTPAEIVRSYLDAFAAGDPDSIVACVTEDFENIHTAALGSGCIGKAEYRHRLPGFLASMPGLRYEIEEVLVDGNRVAAAYTLRAVIDARPIAVRGMMRFELRGPLIARRTDYWDSLVFQRQAGLTE